MKNGDRTFCIDSHRALNLFSLPSTTPTFNPLDRNHLQRCQQSGKILQVRPPPGKMRLGLVAMELMGRKLLRTTRAGKPFNGDAGRTNSLCPCLMSGMCVIWTRRKKKTGRV